MNSQDDSQVFTLSKWKDAVSMCYDGETVGGTGSLGKEIRSLSWNMLRWRCLHEIQMEMLARFRGDVYAGHLSL